MVTVFIFLVRLINIKQSSVLRKMFQEPGSIVTPSATFLAPRELGRFINEIQKYLVEKTRLGIPAMIH